MIQRYNGIEKDDDGAYVYYDDHLSAIERDREEWGETDEIREQADEAYARRTKQYTKDPIQEKPDHLSADLVRLRDKKPMAYLRWAPEGYSIVEPHIPKALEYGPFSTPRAAVDAALREIKK